MIEKWKDIDGFFGYYQVSNLGRVKSLCRKVPIHRQNVDILLEMKRLKSQKQIRMGTKWFVCRCAELKDMCLFID